MSALIRRPKGRGGPAPGVRTATFERGWTHVICCASGPSFSPEQAEIVKAAQPQWRVIVVNNSWQRVPTADALYASDRSWWEMHLTQVQLGFKGECWTQDRWVAHKAGLHVIRHSNEPGLSKVRGIVHSGGNGGYVALGLAHLFGAREIRLVGYDFQDTGGMAHWHGDHPLPLNQDRPHAGWIERMGPMAVALAEAEVRVINCTIQTALECFPRGDLASCL